MNRLPLTVRGVGAAGLAVAALAGGGALRWWPLVGLGAALAVLLALDGVAVAGDRRLGVSRDLSPLVVPRGTPVHSVVDLALPPGRLLVHRSGTDHVDGVPRPLTLPSTAGAARTLDEIPTPRRGLVAVGPLDVTSTGPAGLARRSARVGAVTQVRVLPRPAPVRTLPQGSRRASTGQDERVEHGGTDLVGLHEYVPGDDLRRLHWASSARTGTLMVRDDADPALPHVLVLVDDRATSYLPDVADLGDEAPDDRGALDFEEAVDLACGLLECAQRQGRHARLQSLSGRVDVEVEASGPYAAAHDPRLTHALSELDLVDSRLVGPVSNRDLDLAVLVTGAALDPAEAARLLAGASHPVVLVVDTVADPRPGRSGAVDVLRAGSADALAAAWEVAAR